MDELAGQIGFLIVINLVFTFAARDISVGAHLGGLVGGVLCALGDRRRRARDARRAAAGRRSWR